MHSFYCDIGPKRFRESFNQLIDFIFYLRSPFPNLSLRSFLSVAGFHLRIWRIPLPGGIGFSLLGGPVICVSRLPVSSGFGFSL